MLRRIASLLVTSLVAVACSSSPDETASSDEPVASSDSALTTDDAISRAEQWVGVKLRYCQAIYGGRDYDSACSTYCNRQSNPAWNPYRSDCSGFVSWAWGLGAPGRVTGQFAPFQNDITHAIPASTLQPGDAVNNSDHVMLFKQWITPGKRAVFLEEPGCSSSQPYARENTSDVSLNGTQISVVSNGMTFTAIRYGALQAAVTNVAPKGNLDAASCDGLAGWAQDKDVPAKALGIVFTFDAPAGKPGAQTVHASAGQNRADLCKSLGSCDHGFQLDMPLGARDGQAHTIYAYATDDDGKANAPLANAPKTLTCAPPAFPLDAKQAVRRHVTNPQMMGAWKIDAYQDVAREPVNEVAAYPDGPDMPTKPVAVKADDGTASVWMVDGSVRRQVVDPTSLAAWQVTVATWPAAKVNALVQGPDWPKTMFAFQGDGQPEVYVLDVAAIPAGAGGDPVGEAPTPVEPGARDAQAAADSGGGCSTSPRGGSAGGALALVLAALAIGARRGTSGAPRRTRPR